MDDTIFPLLLKGQKFLFSLQKSAFQMWQVKCREGVCYYAYKAQGVVICLRFRGGLTLRKHINRKTVLWSIGIVVVALAYYWLDNLRIQRSVRDAISSSLTQSLQGEVRSTPEMITSTIPKKDQHAYIVVNHSYRVLNVSDFWVESQIENAARLSLSQDLNKPVCKLYGVSIAYAPAFENVGAFSTVQYVDPFGFVRKMVVNVSVPLRRLPLS